LNKTPEEPNTDAEKNPTEQIPVTNEQQIVSANEEENADENQPTKSLIELKPSSACMFCR